MRFKPIAELDEMRTFSRRTVRSRLVPRVAILERGSIGFVEAAVARRSCSISISQDGGGEANDSRELVK